MNNYEDWAQLVAKRLKGEADIIAAIEKDELDDAAATDAFRRAVLEPFLPENYGLGEGRVVDAFGNYSDHLDIIIYNRDFPRISMRGANDAYLYESVLGAFSVRAKFIRKTFFDAMNACASLAQLETNLDKSVLVKLAKKNGLKPGPNKTFVHEDPLRTGRFELIGRPPAFVFGFSGIKNSYRQLQENIELWIANRQKVQIATPMKALPAVIATQGCFAWRNAAPLALSNREMLGIGNDDAPVRLIVLQLLYLLNRRLNVTSDGYGLKPNLNAYLSQFSAPKFELGVGNVAEVISFDQGTTQSEVRAARDTQRFEPARDHSAAAELEAASKHEAAAAAALQAASKHEAEAAAELKTASRLEAEAAAARQQAPAKPAAAPKPAPARAEEPAAAQNPGAAVFDKPSPFAAPPSTPPASEPAASASGSLGDAAFDKPSPFASAPVPPADEAPMPEPEMPRSPAPVAPLGSAPIPPMQGGASTPDPKPPTAPLGSAPIPPAPEPEKAPPSAPLGSAPIPPMQNEPAAPSPAEAQPAANIIPPKPPVDIDLGHGNGEDKAEASADDDDEFIQTVVIPPNAAASAKENQRSSTDAFIARVKEQLSTSDAPAGKDQDFSSTIPQ